MFLRICSFLLLACAAARADLNWDSTTVLTAAPPDKAPATADFTFTNTGSTPVKILNTRTSCGCTTAEPDQKVIAPGQKGRIHVSFRTFGRHGLYEEPIEVDTDDPAEKRVVLRLRVMVQDALGLQPEFLYWQRGEPLAPKSIRVTVTDGYNVKSLGADSGDPDIEVSVETVKAGAEYKVTVTPKKGSVKGKVTVSPVIDAQPGVKFVARVRVG